VAAEAVGTGLLVLVGGAALLSPIPLGPLGVPLAFGGTVAILVAAFGPVSGAHFNPAVSLAFAATGHLSWRRLAPYVAAQGVGAVLAVLALRGLGPVDAVVTATRVAAPVAVGVEAGATFVLAFTIAAVATGPPESRRWAAPAIGGAVFLGALVAGPFTGGSMNPWRSLAPALVANRPMPWAPYLAAPLAGALAGMFAYRGLRPAPSAAAPAAPDMTDGSP
jgi:glycerol uptake facilitator-like aquaporin